MRQTYLERRDLALSLLRSGGLPGFEPMGAFYVWVNVASRGLSSLEFAQELLAAERVAVAPGSAFGPASEGFVRVSLAAGHDDISTGIEALCRFAERRS